MTPINYSAENIPQFSVYQYDLLGCPSIYGYDKFEIIETPQSIQYVTDYQTECTTFFQKRVVHVYSRLERFQTILTQLMGMTLNVSKRVQRSPQWCDMLDEISNETTITWITIRKILKKYHFNTYYNRIPCIVALATGNHKINNNSSYTYKNIIKDFNKMDMHFNSFKNYTTVQYTYFPNLRYVALKLMHANGYYPLYEIPLAITKSKVVTLDKAFDDFWYFINIIA